MFTWCAKRSMMKPKFTLYRSNLRMRWYRFCWRSNLHLLNSQVRELVGIGRRRFITKVKIIYWVIYHFIWWRRWYRGKRDLDYWRSGPHEPSGRTLLWKPYWWHHNTWGTWLHVILVSSFFLTHRWCGRSSFRLRWCSCRLRHSFIVQYSPLLPIGLSISSSVRSDFSTLSTAGPLVCRLLWCKAIWW